MKGGIIPSGPDSAMTKFKHAIQEDVLEQKTMDELKRLRDEEQQERDDLAISLGLDKGVADCILESTLALVEKGSTPKRPLYRFGKYTHTIENRNTGIGVPEYKSTPIYTPENIGDTTEEIDNIVYTVCLITSTAIEYLNLYSKMHDAIHGTEECVTVELHEVLGKCTVSFKNMELHIKDLVTLKSAIDILVFAMSRR